MTAPDAGRFAEDRYGHIEWIPDDNPPLPWVPAEPLPCGHWPYEACGHPELDADPTPARPVRLSLRQERVRRALTRSPEEQT